MSKRYRPPLYDAAMNRFWATVLFIAAFPVFVAMLKVLMPIITVIAVVGFVLVILPRLVRWGRRRAWW